MTSVRTALAVLAVAVTVGCSCPRADHELEGPIEDPVAADGAVAGRALAYVRTHADRAALASVPGRKLWLCAYDPPSDPRCATGDGATLAESLDRAVDTIGPPPPDVRWKLDIELSRRLGSWPRDARPDEAGTVGVEVDGATILPSEFLERDLFVTDDEDDPAKYDDAAIRTLLAARGATVGDGFDFHRLRTASWVEAAPGAAPIRTYRTHAWDTLDVEDPDQVLTRALWAAEGLSRTVEDDGWIEYQWDVSAGKEKKGSNLLRQAGSTYSLIQAWARTHHEPWREAAGRSIRYLLSKSASDVRNGPYGGGTGRYLVEGTHIKLGGAGLALIALATWQAETGDPDHAGDAREFATFLVSQQRESGEFVYFPNKVPGGEPRDDTSSYYPGEAVLGLTLWSGIDPGSPEWLQTARRGADWLIDVRDAGKKPSQLENDHWLMIALHRLYATTRDERYKDHALRLAGAVRYQQKLQSGHELYHRDYRGGYYEPPRSTPASTRAEGLVAVLELLAESGTGDPELRTVLLDTVRHLSQSQYTPALLYWMPRPGRVAGNLAGGIVHPDLRNDFTQHALSALLGTERMLRREAGSPDPAPPVDETLAALPP